MFKATLEFKFKDRETAGRVLRSIETDNQGFVETKIEGEKLLCFVEAKSVASLRHTLDDLLACADLAQSVILKQEEDK
jgi:tRNA threonylcarbamoyladenosine modification (KEOPS) complex  Pcc1 subunit